MFRWVSNDAARPDDSWEWQRPETGESRRTTQTSVRIDEEGEVCLQVRLVRGTFASEWAQRCVAP